MSKISTLFADLDKLGMTLACSVTGSASRSYLYYTVTVTGTVGDEKVTAQYAGSDLNHFHSKGSDCERQMLPRIDLQVHEQLRDRNYRANSNLFNAVREIADEAMAAA